MEPAPLAKTKLPERIRKKIDYSLLRSTRVHRLPKTKHLWIKREDELSASISGSKIRKYASLIPFLKQNQIQLVGMIGGPNSNNLVGLIQLLRENGITPHAFIRAPADPSLRGNALLLDMLLSDGEYTYIARDDWHLVNTIAEETLQKLELKSTLLSEGCYGKEGLPGSMTLAESVIDNERQSSKFFKRIYIDCGTGLSSIGLITGLELISPETCSNREIVVSLIAEEEQSMRKKLNLMRDFLNQQHKLSSENSCKVTFRRPSISPKFGSVNATLFRHCRDIAVQEGLLMDPTYSVKHFITAREDLHERPCKGTALFVFNGSALGMLGFQRQLAALDSR